MDANEKSRCRDALAAWDTATVVFWKIYSDGSWRAPANTEETVIEARSWIDLWHAWSSLPVFPSTPRQVAWGG